MSSPIARVKVEITREMTDAGRLAYEATNEYPYSLDALVAAYKAMRSLEPGEPDPGVMQIAGVSPYGDRR